MEILIPMFLTFFLVQFMIVMAAMVVAMVLAQPTVPLYGRKSILPRRQEGDRTSLHLGHQA